MPNQATTTVTREQFNEAVEAVWGEIEYQNGLERRTGDEAKEPAGVFTLGQVYLRRGEDAWADHAGTEASLPSLRKLAAIFVRGMVYCGVRPRVTEPNSRRR